MKDENVSMYLYWNFDLGDHQRIGKTKLYLHYPEKGLTGVKKLFRYFGSKYLDNFYPIYFNLFSYCKILIKDTL